MYTMEVQQTHVAIQVEVINFKAENQKSIGIGFPSAN